MFSFAFFILFSTTQLNDQIQHLIEARDYEKAAVVLESFKPDEQGRARYYFYRLVAQHGLLNKKEPERELSNLTDSFFNVPLRYQAVAEAIRRDMVEWKEKDLGEIARK